MISKKAFMGLPVNHRDTRTLFELQHKVAMCSYHLGSIDDAESELQGILQLEPESDEQRIQQCNMNHMLAEIYVRQNKLDAAKAVCK
jgi:predicted Zn-dependent protease